tara:strand:- start:56 stop:244 length:189 start_codon:yes stop_codon:yes gene_type:complete
MASSIMTFKVEDDHEKKVFKEFARAKGMTLSSWVRHLIFNDIATTEQSHLDKVASVMSRQEV